MIDCEKTKLKNSGIKNLGSNLCFLAFRPEMAFGPKIFLQNLKWLNGQKWLLSNESALLLRVLKGLARL